MWGCGPLTKQESDSRSCLERQTEEGNSPVREIRRRPSGIKADRDFRQERLLDFAEKVVNVLWKNQPLFDEPSWLVRCNYRKTDRQYEMKERLYADNKISIKKYTRKKLISIQIPL